MVNTIIDSSSKFRMKLDFIAFFMLIFLACFHLPVFWVGNDSIGLFDIYLFVYFAFALMRIRNDKVILTGAWREYFIVFALYLCYLLLSLPVLLSTYSFTLWIKNLEFLIVLVLLVTTFQKYQDKRKQLTNILQLAFAVMIFYQFAYRTGIINIGFGFKYRLGLPFALGVSSNPAGFVLGAYILLNVNIFLHYGTRKGLSVILLVASLAAMLFTISRTNLLALMVVVFFVVLEKALKTKKGVYVGLGVILVTVILLKILLSITPEDSYLWLFFKIIKDPSALLSDTSFKMRYAAHWPDAINRWLSTPITFLFGTGFGSVRVVDGTIPRLLGSQGLVGFLLFHLVWFLLPMYYYPKNKALKYLLLFAFINGINGETLIVSYRSVQIYVILLAYTIFLYPADAKEPPTMLRKFLNKYFKSDKPVSKIVV